PEGDPVMPGEYTPEELLSDLVRVTGPELDTDLATFVAERSLDLPAWMSANGVRWQEPFRGTLQLGRTNRFFLGGGKALMNVYYRVAESLGIDVRYDSTAVELIVDGDRCTEVVVESDGARAPVSMRAVVAASGGFEANFEWL